jgi:hypothetical protein
MPTGQKVALELSLASGGGHPVSRNCFTAKCAEYAKVAPSSDDAVTLENY